MYTNISISIYIGNLERWYWWIYLQGSNGETEITDLGTRVKGKRGEGEMDGKRNMETYNSICKIDSQWEFALSLRELKEGLFNNWEGWHGEGDWRGVWEGGDMGVPKTDSCWCLTENNNILESNYSSFKNTFFTTLFEHSHGLLLLSL